MIAKLQKSIKAVRDDTLSGRIVFTEFVALLTETIKNVDDNIKAITADEKSGISEKHHQAAAERAKYLTGQKTAYLAIKAIILDS